MRHIGLGIVVLAAVAATWAPQSLRAQAAPIFLDGFFADWTGPVELTDPAGDGVAGVDFRAVDIANDDESLFIRFQVSAEVGLQSTNNLFLYLDTDMNAGTGTAVNGIGAELRWSFGTLRGNFYHGATSPQVFQDDIRLRELPSITSPEFELSIGRNVRPDGTNLLFTGNSIRVQLRHEVTSGDYAPNVGQTLTYTFDATPMPPPAPAVLARQNSADMRVTVWNVVHLENNGGGWNAGVTPSADRVLSALDPDILCFEEIYDNNVAATVALVESFLPSGPGEAWYGRENYDVKVVSRYPVLGTWLLNGTINSSTNLAVLLDTQAVLGHQLLLIAAHMFCCTNDTGRQDESDHIMSFLNDAKNPGGLVTVPFGTVFMITGDLNLVGQSQQLRTLRYGDIVDNATYGPDFAPDWDGSPLADLVSRQTEKRFAYTWRNDNGTFAPGRLDYFIYSDSTAEVGNHFIVYTPEMSASQLALYGMQANDVTTVSDHLPHTADFHAHTATDVSDDLHRGRAGAAWASLRAAALPGHGRARVQLQLERAARVQLDVYDVRGARVATLRSDAQGELPAGPHLVSWDGRDTAGARAPSGTYVVRLVAQAGDVALATSSKLTLLR